MREIGPAERPYLIAELCNNFNGDCLKAEEMIMASIEAGADAVKFQMRLLENRLTPDQHAYLRDLCQKNDIDYIITAFDEVGLSHIVKLNPEAIKIGSGECVNWAFLNKAKEAAIKINVPLIVSTGGTTINQVMAICQKADILMHCTSIYPTPYDKVNLDLIPWYSLDFDIPIGLSDHTPTIWTSIGAIALGASVIEKHVTFDKTQEGPDHASSISFDELTQLREGMDSVWASRGDVKQPYPEEILKLNVYRMNK